MEGQKEHILKIVRNLRRSFPKEAAQEIWDEFRPKMSNFHSSEAMEVTPSATHDKVVLLRMLSLIGDA